MARPRLIDVYKLEVAEYFTGITAELAILFISGENFTESQSGLKLPVS